MTTEQRLECDEDLVCRQPLQQSGFFALAAAHTVSQLILVPCHDEILREPSALGHVPAMT